MPQNASAFASSAGFFVGLVVLVCEPGDPDIRPHEPCSGDVGGPRVGLRAHGTFRMFRFLLIVGC